jgi:hypothetical protein
MKDMLHKIFAHISQESPKSGSRSRLYMALLLTVTVLAGLSFSGVAYAKVSSHSTSNANNQVKANPSHSKAQFNKHPIPTKAQSLAKLQAKAHPNTGLSGYFENFQFVPSYGDNFTAPDGVAVDGSGNIYVSDYNTGNVYLETPVAAGGYVQTIITNIDGGPVGLTVDAYGDVYIAGDYTRLVYIETPNGSGGYTETTTGTSTVAPWAVAVDAYGDIFVTDQDADTVFMETPNGSGGYTESQVDGGFWGEPLGIGIDTYGNLYITDDDYGAVFYVANYGGGSFASPVDISDGYDYPTYVAVANNGTVYVTDAGYGELLALYPEGVNGYSTTSIDGSFDGPEGVAIDSLGNLYVTDYYAGVAYELVTNAGAVQVGNANGTNTNITANFAIGGTGTLGTAAVTTQGETGLDFVNVVADDSCSGVAFSSGGTCSVTVSFAPTVPGVRTGGVLLVDNSGNYVASSAAFSGFGIAPRASFLPGTFSFIGGEYTYAKQAPNFAQAREKAHLKVPKISPHGAAKSMELGTDGFTYPGYEPDGIVIDPSGNYFVADQYYCAVYASFPDNNGPAGTDWVALPMDSGICPSGGLAVDGSGNVFFTAWATFDNGAVIAADVNLGYDAAAFQNVYSYPYPVVIYTDTGSGIPYYINNLAVDAYDNVYFTGSDDSYSDAYAYFVPEYGYNDFDFVNEVSGAFDYLTGIAADDFGDIVVSDYDLGGVYAFIPQSNNTYYSYELARDLDTPVAVSIDDNGAVYIVDSGDDTGISALYLAVGNGGVGDYQGGPTPGFNLIPLNLSYYWEYGDAYYFNFAIDSNNNFYFTDDGYWGGLISIIDVNDPPSLDFETTDIGLISVDSPQTVFLLDTGNDVLTLPVPSSGFNPSISTDFLLNTSYYGYFPGGEVPVFDCPLIASGGTSATISQDNACALPVSFAPLPPAGTDSGTLVVTSDSLYGSASVPLAKGATRMVKAHASVPLTKGGRLAKGVHPLATTAVSQTINLTGIGVDFFTIDFTVTGGGVPPIVKAGGSLAVQIVVAPVAPVTTFPLPVTLSAGGGPQGSSYTFVPSVIPAGAGSTTVTLTINIPIDYVAKNDAPAAPGQNHTKLPVAPLTLALLLLPMAGKLRKAGKRMSRMAALMLLAIAGITATATLIGCGANKAAVYEITVTGTSGILSHSTSFDITVEGR